VFVRAVIFDLFNTLVLIDNNEAAYSACFHTLHDSLVQNKIDVPFEKFIQVYFKERDKLLSEAKKDLSEPHFNVGVSRTLTTLGYAVDESDPVVVEATKVFAQVFLQRLTLDDDAHVVLKRLYGRYKLGLISNLRLTEMGRQLLKKYALEQYFEVMLISGEENVRKPNPRIFEKALRLLGVHASESVFIGDMLDLDVQGPQNVGMKTIFIQRRPIDNMYVQPDHVITRLVEVCDILTNSL
jgi:HAD superfamily hydrolase (TIGR01549 family)